jgi:hypothetical protein
MVPVAGPTETLSRSFRWAFVCVRALCEHMGPSSLKKTLLSQPVPFTTHFSGVGTVELAVHFLRAASREILGMPLQLEWVAACEKKPSNRACLLASSSGESQGCIFGDILARSPVAAEHHARAIAAGRANYAAVWGALRVDGLLLDTAGYCSRHGRSCQLPRPALDVSGSPCTPWSSVGHRGGRASPVTCLFLTWCQWARHVQPLVLIHENVVGWDPTTIDECLGDLYECVTLRTTPADAGFPFMRRDRLYTILYNRSRVRIFHDVRMVYQVIARSTRLEAAACPPLSSCFVASQASLLSEENRVRRLRGLAAVEVACASGWAYLLTEHQQARVQDSVP